jgi:hypothetical protein
MKSKFWIPLLGMVLFPMTSAWAADELNSGDTAWIIVSTALVMMMTPAGLALFYGGMSRYKNLLNTYAMTFCSYCIASIVWVAWGYSLSFGPDIAGFIGGLDHFLFSGIDVGSLSGTIPTSVFALFQMTFAGITVALVLGSVVDRMKFSAWMVFTVLVAHGRLYPHRHWAGAAAGWGPWGPWILPAEPWCTSTPVWPAWCSACSWANASATAKKPCFPPACDADGLGAALLWFGWFGFNAGSQLAADGIGRVGLSGHQHLGRHGGAGLDVRGVAGRKTPHRCWAWLRVSWPVWSPSRRPPVSSTCGSSLIIGLVAGCWVLSSSPRSSTNSGMTTPWMPLASTASAASGAPGHRPFRQSGHQRRSACFTATPDRCGSSSSPLWAQPPLPQSPPSLSSWSPG